jgi:hypothetical protein
MTNKKLNPKQVAKIEGTITRYRKYWHDMNHAVSMMYYVSIRSHMPEEMDAYVDGIIETAYQMAFPEARLFAYSLINLKDKIKARKIASLKDHETKTKFYSIRMSEAEYKAVLKFLKDKRAE